MKMRPLLLVVGLVGALVAPWAAPSARVEALPVGFSDTLVASVPSPTAVEALPGDRVVVLEQDSGRIRLISTTSGQLLPTPALHLAVCSGGERGLLGFTHDPQFAANGRVYAFYTRVAPGAPGRCVNRVSAFTMTGNTISPASERVLIDNISSVNGNHNAGDIDIGRDGYLYISTGDAGRDPRGDSGSGGSNDAARDLSLLNGKILRLNRFTGAPAPGNPLTALGAVACASRGNTATTPGTWCQELFAWGLRNPFRFAFDPNSPSTRFFINDVGQGAREEVDVGAIGADYGWNLREGACPRGLNPPCAGPPPNIVEPILDYPRSVGTFITAGAFVPDGAWPAAFEGGYLFADGGSGKVWLRTAAGGVDYNAPVVTSAFGLTDMAFVDDLGGTSLYYTLNGSAQVRKITVPRSTAVPAGSTTRISGVPNGLAVISVGITGTRGAGYFQVLRCGSRPGAYSNLNSDRAGQTRANLAIVRLDASGSACIYNQVGADIFVDLQGYLSSSVFTPETRRLTDTRQPGPGRPPVAPGGRTRFVGRPNGIAVVSVVATQSVAPGYLQALPCGATPGAYSNLNVDQPGQTIANLAIVQLDSAGEACVYTRSGSHIIVDLQGYLDPSAFTVESRRLQDTRQPPPRSPLPRDGRIEVDGRPDGLAVLSIVATQTTAAGYFQVLGCARSEGAYSNLNADDAGQTRANLAIARLDANGRTCVYTQGGAHVIADLQGYLDPAAFTPVNVRLLDTRQG